MKKIENNFTVTGFVGKDAEIRQFTTASVARFSLAIGRNEKNGEENNRVSAFINVEAWRKNENAESFDKLTKGAMLRRRRKLQRRRPSEPSSSLCIADFLNKGKRKELDFILVQGTISTTQWIDRQGESHTQISINADSILNKEYHLVLHLFRKGRMCFQTK